MKTLSGITWWHAGRRRPAAPSISHTPSISPTQHPPDSLTLRPNTGCSCTAATRHYAQLQPQLHDCHCAPLMQMHMCGTKASIKAGPNIPLPAAVTTCQSQRSHALPSMEGMQCNKPSCCSCCMKGQPAAALAAGAALLSGAQAQHQPVNTNQPVMQIDAIRRPLRQQQRPGCLDASALTCIMP